MRQLANATVFTTGQVAKLCQVAPRTVSKWFDSGQLKGYRIPGSQDRRIPRENLVTFLREHGIPLRILGTMGPTKVLLIAVGEEARRAFERSLPGDRFELLSVETGFEAGAKASSFGPNLIVVDAKMGVNDALTVVRFLKSQSPAPNKFCSVVLFEDSVQFDQFSEFDERFRKPYEPVLLVERVRTLSERFVTM